MLAQPSIIPTAPRTICSKRSYGPVLTSNYSNSNYLSNETKHKQNFALVVLHTWYFNVVAPIRLPLELTEAKKHLIVFCTSEVLAAYFNRSAASVRLSAELKSAADLPVHFD